VSRTLRGVVPACLPAHQGPPQRLALALTSRRTITQHARSFHRFVIRFRPIHPWNTVLTAKAAHHSA